MKSLLGFTNKTMRFASMLLLFFTLNVAAFQSTEPPAPSNMTGGPPPPPPGAPIDNYLWIGLILAFLLGSYKARQIQKKKALKN